MRAPTHLVIDVVLIVAVLMDGMFTKGLAVQITICLCTLKVLGRDPRLLEESGTQRVDRHLRAVTNAWSGCNG